MEAYRNEWIPLTAAEEMAEKDYDVLIVGSGAGGASVLRRLTDRLGDGAKIGMVEAGGLLLPTHGQNLPTVTADRLAGELFGSMSTPLGERLQDYPDAKLTFGLGGRTLFWTGGTPRMPESELQAWPVPLGEMNRYYSLAEEAMRVTSALAAESRMQLRLLERLRAGGFPQAIDLPMAIDLSASRQGALQTGPVFSSMDHLAYAMYRRPLDLAVGARVTEVLEEGGRVHGVTVVSRGRTCMIRARFVVLCAGGFITPQILLHSGIRGEAIGRYLTNHSTVRATGKLLPSQEPGEACAPVVIQVPQTAEAPYQLQLFGPAPDFVYPRQHPQPAPKAYELQMNGFARVESRPENRVYLDPQQRDEDGVPLVQVSFTRSELDLQVIGQTRAAMERAAAVMGFSLAEEDGASPPVVRPPGDDNHEACTCRMGLHPDTSAANAYGQVHGVAGLFVADNSVLPSIGAANPTLTTAALAFRTADYIAEQLAAGE